MMWKTKAQEASAMTIPVTLTEETFRRFTMFDILRRRKMWRPSAIFAAIMGTSACICYYMNHVDGAVLLGNVLMTIGLGMPVVYFTTFFASLRKEVLRHGLKRPQLVYTLELTHREQEGIRVSNEKEQAAYPWKQVFHAYRDMTATYLFLSPYQGFILPHTCIEEGEEELWKLLNKKVPEKRRTDLRK
jgi:hypothetical protein